MRLIVLLVIALALVMLPPVTAAGRWPYVDQLNAQSYQLFVREWGRLSAICSAGAYWTDGKTTRLLTAGHCIALSQSEMGRGVEFLVTQSGSNFQAARVLATGWRLRDPDAKTRLVTPRELFGKLPSPGFLRQQQVNDDRIDISRGDWAIVEIDGKKPIAEIGDSAALLEDDVIYIYGYPLGGDRFFARGYVANAKYRAPSTEWAEGYVAADVTAAPGNSGSLVVDENDRAVAILVAGATDRLHILTPLAMVKKQIPCMAEPTCVGFAKP